MSTTFRFLLNAYQCSRTALGHAFRCPNMPLGSLDAGTPIWGWQLGATDLSALPYDTAAALKATPYFQIFVNSPTEALIRIPLISTFPLTNLPSCPANGPDTKATI